MLTWLVIFAQSLRSALKSRQGLPLEYIALRQQVAILKHKHLPPLVTNTDRFFWVLISRIWPAWRTAIYVFQPATSVRWHRQGFRYFWHWKSRRRVSEAAVSNYTIRRRGPPSQRWRTFLRNHGSEIIALDFFTVPTVTFRVLFVLIILRHDRRRILHFDVTTKPAAQWTARQLLEARCSDPAPRYLLRDNDSNYGMTFHRQVNARGIEEASSAPHSPWQNPYAERVIGTIRPECLNHMFILVCRYLKKRLFGYFDYYHSVRAHMSLG